MRAHYFVWRNLLHGIDMVGFQHYRRWLNLAEITDRPVAYMKDPRLLRRLESGVVTHDPNLGDYDAIAAAPWNFKRTIAEEYMAAHRRSDWEALEAEESRAADWGRTV